jgi:hypothetical protein
MSFLQASFALASSNAEFTFNKSAQNWAFWGSGQGQYKKNIGNKANGSLWISADWGEEETAHYAWSKLAAGNYKVTAFARAQEVQEGKHQTSFWHFYNNGEGIESVFRDLKGSFEWKKIEYTVSVASGELNLLYFVLARGPY